MEIQKNTQFPDVRSMNFNGIVSRRLECAGAKPIYRKWTFHIDANPQTPSFMSKPADENLTHDLQRYLHRCSTPDNVALGAAPAHTEALIAVRDSWQAMISSLHADKDLTGGTLTPQAYMEVTLAGELFGGRVEHRVDCIGNDQFGNFFVVEIGRARKQEQAEKHLYMARTLLPSVSFYGITALYDIQDIKNSGRVFLRCFE